MASRIDPYAVLQVVPTAHDEVLRAAYRTLATLYHPDRNHDPAALDRMIELNRAWKMVSSPTKRAAYDATAAVYGAAAESAIEGAAPAHAAPSAPSRAPWAPAANPFGGASRAQQSGEAAGPPAWHAPCSSVLDFGRYQGWSLGQIARVDRGYLEWFKRTTIGRRYQAEIDRILDVPLDPPIPMERFARPGAARWFARRR